VTRVPWRTGVLLALLPLVFTGKAFLRGELYGPADLYYQHDPWKAVAAENGIHRIENPILSDLAFASLPWRATVRQSLVNGRAPLWNPFVLAGNPLLGTGLAGVLHPATWLGIFLPVPLSWTFSCAFVIFLALLSAHLFFRDMCRSELAALVGAAGWGFSTFVVFWDGFGMGHSVAVFPLLLLGLRRLAREGGGRAIGITATALVLTAIGGHPETLFHAIGAGGVYFLWELFARDVRPRAARAIAGALGAGALSFALSAPVLLPLLEAIPHSAEYAVRRTELAKGKADQSVSALEAARRLRPAILPFSHGIYGKSPVQDWRQDGSGMPLAYAGAVLFPLAVIGLRRRGRERWLFLGFFLVGLAYGASAPVLLDVTTWLPGFALALNYRLVFLAPLVLAGLAALGVDRISSEDLARSVLTACAAVAASLSGAFVLASRILRDRALPDDFVRPSIGFEVVPVVLLLVAALVLRRRPAKLAAAALILLVAQRFLEMRGTYPTLPARSLAPPIPALAALPTSGEPYRVVAAGDVLRPNGASFYGLEDVRGYESIVLNRFVETYPLWCRPQPVSFNRVDDLTRPFLSFLNVRFAVAEPETPAPPGWVTAARDASASVFENPRTLPRAFAPRRVRVETDAKRRLAEMAEAKSFGEVAWVGEAPHPDPPGGEGANGRASVTVREIGTDLVVEADVAGRALVATSIPDWPGWRANDGSREVALTTVNHAFVGFWLEPGRHAVRLLYLPGSFLFGSALAGAAVLAVSLLFVIRRKRR
jgi:membrane protein YfhO